MKQVRSNYSIDAVVRILAANKQAHREPKDRKRQGRHREAGSEGSLIQKRWATNMNRIRGLVRSGQCLRVKDRLYLTFSKICLINQKKIQMVV